MNISKTLSSLSKTGRPLTDQDILKWANNTAQKGQPGVRPIRSFKDPALTTSLFILDLLDAIRPGIVDPSLVIGVDENGDYEDRRQNGAFIPCPLIFCGSSVSPPQPSSRSRSRVRWAL